MSRTNEAKADFPFDSHYLIVDGGCMHYVDVGKGPVLLMVHGTPTSSFLYRHLIADLSRDYRVIAIDHIGFGRSDKLHGWGYRPADHARNLALVIQQLRLRDITLVLHDVGGPIGMTYAIDHPENVRVLVLFNTWLWSLRGTPTEKVSRLMSGRLGQFLYKQLNFSPRVLLKAAFGDKRKLSREAHLEYINAFPTPASREGAWVLAQELIGSSDWYEALWARRDRIAGIPALLLWGLKDPAFGTEALERWTGAMKEARVVLFPEAGHFVQEEAPEQAAREIRDFIHTKVRCGR